MTELPIETEVETYLHCKLPYPRQNGLDSLGAHHIRRLELCTPRRIDKEMAAKWDTGCLETETTIHRLHI